MRDSVQNDSENNSPTCTIYLTASFLPETLGGGVVTRVSFSHLFKIHVLIRVDQASCTRITIVGAENTHVGCVRSICVQICDFRNPCIHENERYFSHLSIMTFLSGVRSYYSQM